MCVWHRETYKWCRMHVEQKERRDTEKRGNKERATAESEKRLKEENRAGNKEKHIFFYPLNESLPTQCGTV